MTEQDEEGEENVVSETGTVEADASPKVAGERIEVNYAAWILTLKQDAEEALEPWESGGQIGPPNSRDIVAFFVIASTYIEEISARCIHNNGKVSVLQTFVNQERKHPPSISSLEDCRNVRQFERERALDRSRLVTGKESDYLENTRWTRNIIAHNVEAAIKMGDLKDKFVKNGKQLKPTELPEQAIQAIREVESEM